YLRIGGGRIKELRSNVETIPLDGVGVANNNKASGKTDADTQESAQKPRPQSQSQPRSIFVGTYEGVDQMIRAGTIGRLGDIGTVVIDEVHMLEDEERGPRLDGLITRLKYLYSQSQYIFLSATVGNPKQLAQGLDSLLIQYEERPVPLERHLIFTTPNQKMPFIRRLALEAYNKKSSKGYRGQTIVFTNSRHNCTMIASSMDSQNLHAAPYHAGLPPNARKKVELGFERGHIAVVVTTAALAAGVDFPASQVIFETLAMGIEWLKSSEFTQMQGRAGRPDYHDLGTVVLLVEPEKRYSNQGMAEDDVAVRLLEGNVEDIDVEYDERAQLEQTLADAACIAYNQTGRGTQVSLNALNTLHKTHLGHFDLKFALKRLKEYGFVERENIRPTRFGKIVTTHFLDTDKAFIMYDMVKDGQNPVDILVQLSTFVNVFFKHQGALSKTLGTNVPKRVFQGAALDIVFSGEGLSQLEGAHQQELIDFALDFLSCTCKESPYCGCPEKKFSRKLIDARASGKDAAVVIDDAYGIYAYTADLLNYFDDCVRNLEAVVLIAKMVGNEKVRKDATNLLKSMS
ncbi:MAG: DEAD/DEAH box helicase, partial [Methanosarcinales archaeon]|nr:DEAD/DEAH box helicase [Methanosarcinales archaeon]